MQNFELASAYVTALTGSSESVMDWRCLSDVDRGAPGQVFRGTLAQAWEWLCAWNNAQHGCFVTVSQMDGHGREMHNVQMIRAHVVDHDGIDAQQQSEAAAQWLPAPGFRVFSSPGKYHTYWPVIGYQDNDRFKTVQRKLRTLFNGDKAVIDATRVLRVPGTLNHKYSHPYLAHCEALPGYGHPLTVDQLEAALAHVTVIDHGGERHNLGDVSLAAPSVEWLKRALELVDPNELSREDWLGITAAFKQSGWTLMEPDDLKAMWLNWCSGYTNDSAAENEKLWRSIDSTQLGWKSLVSRIPSLKAMTSFGVTGATPAPAARAPSAPPMPTSEPPALDCSGEFLTSEECKVWFKGCVFVGSMGKMMLPNGRFYTQTSFNSGDYSGKKFIITQDGKTTDEPWKAATRSTLWRVPKVDHLRFLPDREPSEIIVDVLGRKGVNTYVRPAIDTVPGDVGPFLRHLQAIIPDPNDLNILLDWMAAVVQFPGFKIPWAPVIQSAEGIGKNVIKIAMTYAVGAPYVHFPDAQQLADSGGKFNGWMRGKVFILADEIKVDEKRHLVEVLKPLISEELIEVQSKGVDQEMEDNCAKWMFFSNWKDAVPVSRNGRRYAIFYSPIQTFDDLLSRGMDDDYFKALYKWLRGDGQKHVAHYLSTRPVSRDSIPMRAPITTSWDEAVNISRSPIERALTEAIETRAPGFAAGWVSEIAALKHMRDRQVVRGNLPPHAIRAVLEGMGYREAGRQIRPYFQEDVAVCGVLYSLHSGADVARYGIDQGYE